MYAARGFFYDGVRPSDGADYGMTERVKVAVGIVGRKRERVFALEKDAGFRRRRRRRQFGGVRRDHGPPSGRGRRAGHGRARARRGLRRGSRAGRAAAVAQLQGLNENAGARAPKRGDVVRAFTTTTLSYGPRAQLLGDLSGTKRAVVLFGADDQPWGKTIGALKSGLVADGAVTLILERDYSTPRAPRRGPRADAGPRGGDAAI